MHTLRYALLALGLALGSATACDVEDVEFEDFEELDEDAIARAAAFSCSAISNETTLCIGDSVCSSTAHGQTHYRIMPPGGCNAGETEIPSTTVDIACGGATAVTTPPTCPDGCSGPETVTSKTAACCTAKKTCYDTPVVEPVDPVDAEDIDADADADADVEPS